MSNIKMPLWFRIRQWFLKSWVSRLLAGIGVGVVVLIFLALSVAAIWWLPGIFVNSVSGGNSAPSLTPNERVTAVTNARQGVLFIVGGAIAVFTLLITLAKHNLDRRGQELDRDENRTTRYTEAIKQLGDSQSFAIRLGGIYALERIAQDSTRDRQSILNVLWAYLRAECLPQSEREEEAVAMKSTSAAAAEAASHISQFSPPRVGVNLAGLNLPGVVLANTTLTSADLNHADLRKAVFYFTDLTHSIFRSSDLREAELYGADLREADLGKANLGKANLGKANLGKANLREANLREANLREADLTDAWISSANLREADLTGAYRRTGRSWSPYGGGLKKVLVTMEYLQQQGAIGVDTVNGLPADESPNVP